MVLQLLPFYFCVLSIKTLNILFQFFFCTGNCFVTNSLFHIVCVDSRFSMWIVSSFAAVDIKYTLCIISIHGVCSQCMRDLVVLFQKIQFFFVFKKSFQCSTFVEESKIWKWGLVELTVMLETQKLKRAKKLVFYEIFRLRQCNSKLCVGNFLKKCL